MELKLFICADIRTTSILVSFFTNSALGRVGLVVAKSVCVCVCLFVPFPCNFFAWVRSVPRPWTGADCALPSRGALKTGRCSKLGGIFFGQKKNAISPQQKILVLLSALVEIVGVSCMRAFWTGKCKVWRTRTF